MRDFSSARLVCWQLALAVVAAMVALNGHAVPYNGEAFTYLQPDGSTFTVKLWGDEFFAYQETEDGHLVVRDPKSRFYSYARVSADGSDIVSTGVRVGKKVPPGLARSQRLSRAGVAAKGRAARDRFGVDSRGRLKPSLQSLYFPSAAAGKGVMWPGTLCCEMARRAPIDG